jgi:UDP-N-acetylmuramoyl-L-alanyl-D-glutamate--2,6-diaminopimelate ligase
MRQWPIWQPGSRGSDCSTGCPTWPVRPTTRELTWSLEPTRPGDLHINLLGAKRAPAAVRRAVLDGAVAVCWSKPNAELVEELRAQGVPVLEVTDERRAMSLGSALLHGFPSKDIAMIGITGTNAKTRAR